MYLHIKETLTDGTELKRKIQDAENVFSCLSQCKLYVPVMLVVNRLKSVSKELETDGNHCSRGFPDFPSQAFK